MKKRTCCFTGHRELPDEDFLYFANKLLDTIIMLANNGVTHFKNGGALGFDQLAAQAVLHARESNPSITLEIILPHKNQAARWDEVRKEFYNEILTNADKVVYVSDHYYDGCMRKRNLCLVEGSDYCIAYFKHMRSGTSQTVRLAKERGLIVINLADEKCLDFLIRHIAENKKVTKKLQNA